jgi:GNAT superfamily N-acetyltransferase
VSGGPVDIRPGSVADLDAVIALMDEAITWMAARGQTGQWGAQPTSERPGGPERLRATIGAGTLELAWDGPRAVGALITGPAPGYVPAPERPELYVNLLVSSRRSAGRGIGAALARAAVERARAVGAAQLRVDCWAGAPRLVRFYEEQGFVPAGTFAVGDWPGQIFVMELTPSAPCGQASQ